MAVYVNNVLTAFDLSSLASVGGDLTVGGKIMAQCLVDALIEQIEDGDGIGGEVIPALGDTLDSCTCSSLMGAVVATCP